MSHPLHKTYPVTVAVALFTLVNPDVRAALLTQEFTESFSLSSASIAAGDEDDGGTSRIDENILSFPTFNSSLGTLSSVDLSFSSDWNQDGSLTAFSELAFFSSVTAGGTGTATTELDVSLLHPSGPGQSLNESVSLNCSESGSGAVVCTDSSVTGGVFNGTLDLSALPLADFQLPAPPIDDIELQVARTLKAIVNSCDDDAGDSCLVSNTANAWAGSATLTYTYDDAPVSIPTPSSILIFSAGLLNLWLVFGRSMRPLAGDRIHMDPNS